MHRFARAGGSLFSVDAVDMMYDMIMIWCTPLWHVVARVAIPSRVDHQPLTTTDADTVARCFGMSRFIYLRRRVAVTASLLRGRQYLHLKELSGRIWHLCGEPWMRRCLPGFYLRHPRRHRRGRFGRTTIAVSITVLRPQIEARKIHGGVVIERLSGQCGWRANTPTNLFFESDYYILVDVMNHGFFYQNVARYLLLTHAYNRKKKCGISTCSVMRE